jgi:hypothetical protein
MSTIINATTTTGVVIQPDNSGSLVLQTNSGTTALTIDTSQNVGIGTTSPAGKLEVNSAGNPKSITSYSTVNFAAIGAGSAGSGVFYGTGTFFTFNNQPFADRGTDNNLTERMRIDSSGRVTMPFQPAFYGYRTAGNVSATTTVLHNVVVTNVGSCYNSGTGIFTCPVAGVYEIYAGGHGENSQPTVLDIQLNGTAVAQEYSNGAAYGVNSLMAIISCAANDQIKSVVTTGTFWAGNISGLKMTVKLIG